MSRDRRPAPIISTDAAVRALKPLRALYERRDALTRGLIVIVHPSGRKQFSLRYRTKGKHRRLVLGDFPGLTLANARVRARAELVKIQEGHDRALELRLAKAKREDTVAALIASYLEQHAHKHKRTADADERMLTVDVLPKWGDRPVRDITRRDVRELLERIVARGAPIAANRTHEVIRKMFNFGVQRDWLEGNPAANLERPGGRERSRDRVLTDDELRALWALLGRFPATEQKQAPGRKRATVDAEGRPFCPISPALAAVTKLRLLTAQRGGEVVQMRWDDVDLHGWWTIPAEHSKNGRPHRVPLVDDAVTIIAAQQPDLEARTGPVFTGREGALVVDRLPKAGAALSRVLGFSFRSHDLRRTAATNMQQAGISREDIAAVLNHTPAGPVATRTYTRYERDREKRAALSAWADRLQRILEAPAPAVLAFGRRR